MPKQHFAILICIIGIFALFAYMNARSVPSVSMLFETSQIQKPQPSAPSARTAVSHRGRINDVFQASHIADSQLLSNKDDFEPPRLSANTFDHAIQNIPSENFDGTTAESNSGDSDKESVDDADSDEPLTDPVAEASKADLDQESPSLPDNQTADTSIEVSDDTVESSYPDRDQEKSETPAETSNALTAEIEAETTLETKTETNTEPVGKTATETSAATGETVTEPEIETTAGASAETETETPTESKIETTTDTAAATNAETTNESKTEKIAEAQPELATETNTHTIQEPKSVEVSTREQDTPRKGEKPSSEKVESEKIRFPSIKAINIDIREKSKEAPADTSEDFVGTDELDYSMQREWGHWITEWEAPDLFHNPLYFQDVTLERYGQTLRPYGQVLRSTGHFLGSAALWPVNMIRLRPRSRVTPFGYERPGDCVPFTFERIIPIR